MCVKRLITIYLRYMKYTEYTALLETIRNKNSFQWDAYRLLVDRIT